MKKSLFPIFFSALTSVVSATDYTVLSTDSSNPTVFTSFTNSMTLVNGSGTEPLSDVYGSFGGFNAINKGSVIFEENVHLVATSANNLNTVMLEMAKGSSLTVGKDNNRGGFAIFPDRESMRTSNIRGSINVYGRMNANPGGSFGNDRYLFQIGYGYNTDYKQPTVNFGNGASITQHGIYGAYNDFDRPINKFMGGNVNNKVVVSIGSSSETVDAGSFVFDDFLYFAKKVTLNLYSTNVIISGAAVENNEINKNAGFTNATSQANSTFFVRSAVAEADAAGNLTLNSFVSNEIGTIDAFTGSTIKLISETLNEGESLILHNLKITADSEGNKALTLMLNFNENTSKNMQIENFYDLYNDEDVDMAIQIYNHSKGSYEDGILGENFAVSQDGWFSTVAVPEPAEWAMIFGAIALAVVAYRKRR